MKYTIDRRLGHPRMNQYLNSVHARLKPSIAESRPKNIFVIVGCDVSASMREISQHEIAWRLKQLCDRLRVRCVVIAWSDKAGILYSARDVAEASGYRFPNHRGEATFPRVGSSLAYKIFSQVPSSSFKFWFNISDGEWHSEDPYVLDMARDFGVVTSLTLLNTGPSISGRNINRVPGYRFINSSLSFGQIVDHVASQIARTVSP